MRKIRLGLVTLGFILAIALTMLWHSHQVRTLSADMAEKISINVEDFDTPTLYYGIPVDSLEITTGKVKWNQNLSEILVDFNISYQDLHILSKVSKEVYDVRKLKAGSSYSIVHESDSLQTAHYFIFEPTPAEFVVYSFADTIEAKFIEKPMEVRERAMAAEITSSLYQSVLDKNGTPQLVDQLVDVFAWQVDFFRIAKGDKFKIIFEEEFVDGEVVGIRSIKGAYFEHSGKPFYAFPFNTGEKIDYFDKDGNSLRKTFLRAPLNFTRISSRYSLRRFHPVQKRYKAHLGTDYAAPTGTKIRTVGDGVVLEARYHRANGNYVKVRHNSNYTTQYLHMSKIAKGIRPGTKVKQGQTIGYVGSTGLANGPHLCFRFWKNGRQVDALKVDLPSSKGIEKHQMADFEVSRDIIQSQLDQLEFDTKEKLLAKIPGNTTSIELNPEGE